MEAPIHTEPVPIPVHAQLALLANLASVRINSLVTQRLAPLDLSQIQYHTLYVLEHCDCWMRQRDVNSVLKISKKRLRTALVQLADRELIQRIVPPGRCRACDQAACYRCATLRIAPLGSGILRAADILAEDAYRELSSSFTPSEYQNLLVYLKELSGVNLELRLGRPPKVLAFTPQAVNMPKFRPAG